MRELVMERSRRYLDVQFVLPIDCTALNAQIDLLKTRLADLRAERDAETDPVVRRRYAQQIAALINEIAQLTARAAAGCV